jgi:hypothetical protein
MPFRFCSVAVELASITYRIRPKAFESVIGNRQGGGGESPRSFGRAERRKDGGGGGALAGHGHLILQETAVIPTLNPLGIMAVQDFTQAGWY